MDFPNIPQWHKGITIQSHNHDKPTIEAGDRLENNFENTIIRPIVLVILPSLPSPLSLDVSHINTPPGKENTPSTFSWQGSFYGLVIGKHMFRFLESETSPGGTKFVQAEDVSGSLQFLFAGWWPKWLGGINEKTLKDFDTLNKDLKRKAESSG
jgi:hypothetical protein